MLSDDYDEAYRNLEITLANVSVIETARKDAGIIFPGDE